MLSRASAKDPPAGGRLLAGYLDRPLFIENFSAPESLDAFSHRSLDDWNTFYIGALRLIEYLNHVGYSGLMLTVVADGSSLYPSQRIAPTPRHDTGVFFASGQDPKRKDVLEMLFRLFDREGLASDPHRAVRGPLGRTGRLAARNPRIARRVGMDRRRRQCAGNSHAFPPRARALLQPAQPPRAASHARRGQRADRTLRGHASFRGVGVQLAADGYAQLPGSEGSYDDDTIASFTSETNTEVPGTGPTRYQARAQFLAGGNPQWLAWRTATLSDLYKRMSQVIAAARPEARLYLAGVGSFDSPAASASLRPALPRHIRVDEALAQPSVYCPKPFGRIRSCCCVRIASSRWSRSPRKPSIWSWASIRTSTDCAGAKSSASLFFHEPKKMRLASFDAKNPFGPGNSYTWLASQFSPSGVHNRERFVHSLAVLDCQAMFDGGWMLPLGQEESIADLVSVYRELPSARFETLPGELQPVVVRTLVQDGQTFVYIVNDSPWPVTLKLRVDAPSGCRLDRLGTAAATDPLARDAEGALWNVSLRPYDLVGGRFSAANVKLSQPEVEVAEQAQQTLRRRIHDLSARAATLGQSPRAGRPGQSEFRDGSGRRPDRRLDADRARRGQRHARHRGAARRQTVAAVQQSAENRHAPQRHVSHARNRPALGMALAARRRPEAATDATVGAGRTLGRRTVLPFCQRVWGREPRRC